MGSAVRGVDHVGVTVPDIEEATRFFVEAFDAEVLYDLVPTPGEETTSDPGEAQARLGTRPGVRWIGSRLLRLGEGPTIELFEYDDPGQVGPPSASDMGVQHFALYVDDMHAVRESILAAGGTPLEGPNLLPGLESGDGNMWHYTLAPWGGIIELVSYPSPQPYETDTPLRRWRPPPSDRSRKETS